MSRSSNTSAGSARVKLTSSLTDMLLKKTAQNIRKIQKSNNEFAIRDKAVRKDCSVQEYIPVKSIENGFVITTDNRYLMLLEIDCTNFDQMMSDVQSNILYHFAQLFRRGYVAASIHVLSDVCSPNPLLNEIYQNCKNETDPQRIAAITEYQNYIVSEMSTASVLQRYILVAEYSPREGERSYDKAEILEQMEQMRNSTISSFTTARNQVLFDASNANKCTAELLYYFFNRKSSKTISLEDRLERAEKDYEKYTSDTKVDRKATIVDAISPKGLRFEDPYMCFQDGQYYTYLGAKGNGWPSSLPATWLSLLTGTSSDCIDLTVRFSLLPQKATEAALAALTRIRKSNLRSLSFKNNRAEKLENAQRKYESAQSILNGIKTSDDLYNVDLIVTLRGSTKKVVKNLKASYLKAFDNYFNFEDSYLCAEDYYRAAMPLLCKSNVLPRLHRQVLSTHIGYMYPFVANRINQPKGAMLGMSGATPIILDNFAYPAGHMFLVGTTGAGKTFAECVIAGRYSMTGTRINCICPAKGGEYQGLVNLYGGQMVSLLPGGACVNIMDIRPEAQVKKGENVAVSNQSCLAKKLRVLISWFTLNLSADAHGEKNMTREQYAALEALLISLYQTFGITYDNNTILDEHGNPKKMPILQDWYDEMVADPLLKNISYGLERYVENTKGIKGSGYNLNGQTNVDLTKMITVYDVDFSAGSSIPSEYGPAYLYLAFNSACDRVKEDLSQRDLIVIDEAWMMMKNPDCGSQVADAIKLLRSFHGACLIATQEIADFVNGAGDYGRTVINLCLLKMFLKASDRGVRMIKQEFDLSEDESKAILDFAKGDALLIADTKKVKLHITPTQTEFDAYNTDREMQGKKINSK